MGPAGGRASKQLLGQLLRSEVSISALDLASLFLGTLHMFFSHVLFTLVPSANFSFQTAAASP